MALMAHTGIDNLKINKFEDMALIKDSR